MTNLLDKCTGMREMSQILQSMGPAYEKMTDQIIICNDPKPLRVRSVITYLILRAKRIEFCLKTDRIPNLQPYNKFL